jgi:hypothetical protein
VSGVERYTMQPQTLMGDAWQDLVAEEGGEYVRATDYDQLSRRVAELEGAVTAHVADLEKVAAIFREAGMTESADETDAAVAELRAALKGQG